MMTYQIAYVPLQAEKVRRGGDQHLGAEGQEFFLPRRQENTIEPT